MEGISSALCNSNSKVSLIYRMTGKCIIYSPRYFCHISVFDMIDFYRFKAPFEKTFSFRPNPSHSKNVSPVNMSEDGSINKVCKLLGVDDGKPIGEGYYQSVFLCTEGGRYS